MTKDRPFKNYKTPSERPFKTYDPGSRLLYDNNSYSSEQQHHLPQQQQSLPFRLNSMSALLQQQQQQLQQHQQQQQTHMFSQSQQQPQPSPSANQVYGDPEDFMHINQNSQSAASAIMNIDPTINPYYDDLGLDDTDNPLIRPELLVTNETLLQREQDLNISNTTPAPPNFIMPSNRHLGLSARLPPSSSSASMQDSLSMLFEPQPSLAAYSSPATVIASSSSSNVQPHQYLLSKTADSNGLHPSSSSSFPVKQEADEGRSSLVESPSPSVQSPSQSEPADSFSDTASKTALKRTMSDSASTGSGEQGSQSEQGTSGDGGAKAKSESPKDPGYLEKRRKNNESAKRSREARRSKEELVALRVITLEEENMKLRAEIQMLDKELDELRQRLFQQ